MNIDAAVQDLIDMILAGMHQQMIGGNNHWILQIITHIYKKNTARSGTRFGRSWCQIWTIVGDGGETFFKFCHPGAEYVGHIWCHQNSIFVISPEFWKILKIEHKKIWKVMEKIWTHGKMWDIYDAGRGLLLLLSNPSNLVVDPVVCDIYNIWVQYFLFSPKIKRIFF